MIVSPVRQRGYEHAVAAVRAALGERAFEEAWAEGALLALEKSIAVALDGCTTSPLSTDSSNYFTTSIKGA